MEAGLFFRMDQLRGRPDVEVFDEVVRQTMLAEELGYGCVWLTEHQFHADDGHCPSPLMMLVKLAGQTTRIRLGTAVVVVPLNHPLRVAGEAALCDVLTGGRLELGLGSGYAEYEFAAYSVPHGERRERLSEGIDIITGAWRSQRFSYEGTYFRFPEVEVYPRPLQRPHPPLWMSAFTRETAIAAGRRGMHLMQTAGGAASALDDLRKNFAAHAEAWLAGGHPGRPEHGLARYVYIAESQAEALRDAAEPMVAFMRHNATTFPRSYTALAPDDITLERLLRQRTITIGDPDSCRADLLDLREATEFTHLMSRMFFRGVPGEKVERSMRLFAAEVMPALRPTAPPLAAATGGAPRDR